MPAVSGNDLRVSRCACAQPRLGRHKRLKLSYDTDRGRGILVKKALVCGAGGFIGGHLVKRLKSEGFWVRAVDIKDHEYAAPPADEFVRGDLRDPQVAQRVVEGIDDIYQLAADMGGAGYIFTGEHDAAVMHNSATINLNMLEFGTRAGVKRFFYSSSACIYPGVQPDRSRQPEVLRGFRLSGRTR